MIFAKFNVSKAQYTIPALIFLLAVIGYLLPDSWQQALVYQRTNIASGQWWRLITGHLLHTNFHHLALNLAALVLLLLLHSQYYQRWQYFSLMIVSALLISSGLYFFEPSMQQYVGLSGVLHGVFIWGALKDIQTGDKTGWLLLLGALIKVGHEQIFGASNQIEQLISAHVAINAHLFGLVAGMGYFFTTEKMMKKASS